MNHALIQELIDACFLAEAHVHVGALGGSITGYEPYDHYLFSRIPTPPEWGAKFHKLFLGRGEEPPMHELVDAVGRMVMLTLFGVKYATCSDYHKPERWLRLGSHVTQLWRQDSPGHLAKMVGEYWNPVHARRQMEREWFEAGHGGYKWYGNQCYPLLWYESKPRERM